MPLVPIVLSASLASSWLVPPGGSYPDSPSASGDRFAGAVSTWFATAMAGPFPCVTASARRSQLAASAAGAFAARSTSGAASLLATGLMGYLAGQAFGPGVASPPTATGAAQAMFQATFANVDLDLSGRADQFATAIHTMAISTLVVFPPVISPPMPVL